MSPCRNPLQLPGWFRWWGRILAGGLTVLLVAAVRLYQWTISPLLGRWCRFYPSCSEYFIQSVKKYGPWRGTLRGLWRILRCNPFHPGGYDPP
ncbi:MAG: membrane protein insertion efficiency factor YidD [Thermoguttaceae bacterium]|nr:membrane protein insertion efficiency factor YidD [Thermoguttaceae bacterium]MDW8077800.1 membrane protein insertion efficiency factor YidD [Thermoguttaceae bacterium]